MSMDVKPLAAITQKTLCLLYQELGTINVVRFSHTVYDRLWGLHSRPGSLVQRQDIGPHCERDRAEATAVLKHTGQALPTDRRSICFRGFS